MIVAQLLSMGFSENGCKRAAVATKNAGAEAAAGGVFAHMGDDDFNDPLPPPGAAAGGGGGGGGGGDAAADPDSVMMLCGMGFTEDQAKAALVSSTGRGLERAAVGSPRILTILMARSLRSWAAVAWWWRR